MIIEISKSVNSAFLAVNKIRQEDSSKKSNESISLELSDQDLMYIPKSASGVVYKKDNEKSDDKGRKA